MGIYIDVEFPRRCLECPMYIDMYRCIWIERGEFDKEGKMKDCPLISINKPTKLSLDTNTNH